MRSDKICAAVIGAGSESIPAIHTAHELGLYVIAFDGDENASGLKEADEAFAADIRYPENLYPILDRYNLRLVLPVPIGRCLITAGAVNDHYRLPGVSRKAADLCTDKWKFHRILQKHSLRNIRAFLLEKGLENVNLSINEIDFPCILKPRFGSGSRAVTVSQDMNCLKKELEAVLPLKEDFIIETCVEGMEYGVDGAVIGGIFYLILLRKKINTEVPYRQCVGYLSVANQAEDRAFFDCLSAYLESAIRILGVNDCLFHADMIRDKTDCPFLIELSARPSGHNLNHLFTPMVTNISGTEEFLKYSLPELGQEYHFSPQSTRQMMIRYFDLSGIVKRVPDEAELVKRFPLRIYRCNISIGDRLENVVDGASVMRRGYFVLEAESEERLIRLGEELLNEFIMEETDENELFDTSDSV